MCREEAKELSSLKPQLDRVGVPLYAVVHEDLGSQVRQFRSFFEGDIFLDPERQFYGPRERWMFLSGIVRPSVWRSIMRAKGKSVEGNLKGEGRLLGGVFVIGPPGQGILYEHREAEWGDHANLTEISDALSSMYPPGED